MFYNESLKQEFIEERQKEVIIQDNILRNIFQKSERMETEMNKDVSMFSISEILDYYKLIGTKSIDVLININTQLSKYTSWCMSRGMIPTGINNYQEVTIEMMNQCVNKLAIEDAVMSQERVYQIVNGMYNLREKFVIMMLYETGKTKNYGHIFKAKLSDFDKDKLIFHSSDGRDVSISPRLYSIAEATDKEYDYNSYFKTDDPKIVNRQRKLLENGYIYKETDTIKNTSIRAMINRMELSVKKGFDVMGIGKWVKLKDFQVSGAINHIRDLAKQKGITTEEVLWDLDLRRQIEHQHAMRITSPKQFIRKYKDFL